MKKITVKERIQAHYNESLKYFPEDRIVGIFLVGSQNYGISDKDSDVDSKLIIIPSFDDIVFNRTPKSTTHNFENEQIDFKDIRVYFQVICKQNINFVETLFTSCKILNPLYEKYWNELESKREAIARLNPTQCIKSTYGQMRNKYKNLKHLYPTKVEVIEKYGYDPKQLCHLLRFEEFLGRYINGEKYEDCLRPRHPEYLLRVKKGYYDLASAEIVAKSAIDNASRLVDNWVGDSSCCEEAKEALNKAQYDIMRLALKFNLLRKEERLN